MKQFQWLLRRESWEHRSFFLIPFSLAAVFVVLYAAVLFLTGQDGMIKVNMNGHVVDLQSLFAEHANNLHGAKLAAGALPFLLPTILLNAVMIFVLFFYLIDSLYSESKDRSILFFKSLPITDSATVLSKLTTAMLVIPAITLGAILLAALLMTVVNTFFIWSVGHSAMDIVWTQVPVLLGPLTLLYGFLVQSLWFAPVFAWLLLASAWAKRAPALWAILPPAAIALLEWTALGSGQFITHLLHRLAPIVPTGFVAEDLGPIMNNLHYSEGQLNWSEVIGQLLDPQSILSDPNLWLGLVVAAIFVAAAIWLRRFQNAV